MIETIVDTVAGLIGATGLQTGVLAFLAAVGLYSRKALGLGSLLAGWVRTVSVVAIVLVVLLATGVLEGIDVDATISLVRTVWDVLAGPIARLVGVIGA